jgi:hypothetical protein
LPQTPEQHELNDRRHPMASLRKSLQPVRRERERLWQQPPCVSQSTAWAASNVARVVLNIISAPDKAAAQPSHPDPPALIVHERVKANKEHPALEMQPTPTRADQRARIACFPPAQVRAHADFFFCRDVQRVGRAGVIRVNAPEVGPRGASAAEGERQPQGGNISPIRGKRWRAVSWPSAVARGCGRTGSLLSRRTKRAALAAGTVRGANRRRAQ